MSLRPRNGDCEPKVRGKEEEERPEPSRNPGSGSGPGSKSAQFLAGWIHLLQLRIWTDRLTDLAPTDRGKIDETKEGRKEGGSLRAGFAGWKRDSRAPVLLRRTLPPSRLAYNRLKCVFSGDYLRRV